MEKGMREGRKEGRKDKAIEIAKNMIKKNMEIAIISEFTGLTEEEIEKINVGIVNNEK